MTPVSVLTGVRLVKPVSGYSGAIDRRLQPIVEFLNTDDRRRFAVGGEQHVPHDLLRSPSDLKRFLVGAGLMSERVRVSRADLDAAKEFRDQARRAISKKSRRSTLGAYPLLVELGSNPRLVPDATGAEGAVAELVIRCIEAANQGSWPRLKICAADDCGYVFYDSGKNQLGRWCSMKVCGNRVKTRMYRARQLAGGKPSMR
jgi:predicted RNA-binding Zn ribbon-like protein